MKTTLRMTRTVIMTMPMGITMMGTAMRVMGFLSATLAGPVRAKNLRL